MQPFPAPFHVEMTTVPAVYDTLAYGSCAVPITSRSDCSAAAAFLALSDTTASYDGHRLRQRRQDDVVAPLHRSSDCDANLQTRYYCDSRATPEACRTDGSIGTQCSDDCCGIGVNYHPPYCCEIDLSHPHPPRPAAPEWQRKSVRKPRHVQSRRVAFACAGHCAVLSFGCFIRLLLSTVESQRHDHSCSKLSHILLHVVSRMGPVPALVPPLAIAIADLQDGDLKFNPEGRNTGLCSAADVCLCACYSLISSEPQASQTLSMRISDPCHASSPWWHQHDTPLTASQTSPADC